MSESMSYLHLGINLVTFEQTLTNIFGTTKLANMHIFLCQVKAENLSFPYMSLI